MTKDVILIQEIVNGLTEANKIQQALVPDQSRAVSLFQNVHAMIVGCLDDPSDSERHLLVCASLWLEIAAKYPTIAGHIMESINTTNTIDQFAEAINIFCQQEFGW